MTRTSEAGGPVRSETMLTETIIEDERWQGAGLDRIAERAAIGVFGHLELEPGEFEISVLGCDDARIAALNADFRGKPAPTNVLSWPSDERGAAEEGTPPRLPQAGAERELGDIAIAYETCAHEADVAGKPLADHATHLIVHAVLHLLGYDHIRDKDATLMEATEAAILGKLGIDNPY